MRGLRSILLLMLMLLGLSGVSGQAGAAASKHTEKVPFVMQMTAEESQQRRAFLQIAKVLEDRVGTFLCPRGFKTAWADKGTVCPPYPAVPGRQGRLPDHREHGSMRDKNKSAWQYLI